MRRWAVRTRVRNAALAGVGLLGTTGSRLEARGWRLGGWEAGRLGGWEAGRLEVGIGWSSASKCALVLVQRSVPPDPRPWPCAPRRVRTGHRHAHLGVVFERRSVGAWLEERLDLLESLSTRLRHESEHESESASADPTEEEEDARLAELVGNRLETFSDEE